VKKNDDKLILIISWFLCFMYVLYIRFYFFFFAHEHNKSSLPCFPAHFAVAYVLTNCRTCVTCWANKWMNEWLIDSDRGNVCVDRTRGRKNCWSWDRTWKPTRPCRRTARTSAGACCRETRCTRGRTCRSRGGDKSLSWCRRLGWRCWNLPESPRCVRAEYTRRRSLLPNSSN